LPRTAARRLLPFAGILAALLPFAAVAEAPVWAERPDDQVYVFGLSLDRYVLSDGLVAFYDGAEAFAPLGALVELLEFPIAVDSAAGTAEGWFLDEARTFRLDLPGAAVEISGRRQSFSATAVEAHPDDIYVALSELERWFPLAMELQFANLTIVVTALEPLPLQERRAREERRRHLRRDASGRELELVGPEARWFDWPFVDTSMEVSGRRQDEGLHRRGRLTTTMAGIVGGLDGEATTIADSDQEVPNFRLRLGRRSLEGGLLGPLDAREFALGDVSTPNMPLVADNAVGRGLEVSTFDLDRLEQTNRVTLRGELPIGWEVEVYRNGELIDFQTDSDVGDGRYEFANLDTVAGFNEFRLVFFGPQGQKRELVENYFVSPNFVEPGRTDFRFAANQRNRDLIDLDDTTSRDPDDGEGRVVLQVEHGLSETLSIGAGAANLSVDGRRRTYGSVNLQGSLLGALGQLDAAVHDGGGLALGGRVQTRLYGWSIFGEQSFFEGFQSEETDNTSVSGHLRSRSTLRLNGHLPDFGFGHQPLSASVTHDISEQGDWQTTLFGRLSAIVRPLNLSLSTSTRLRRDRDAVSDARLLVGTLMGPFRLRGEVGAKVVPETRFDQVTLSADWRIDQDFGARLGLRHQGGDAERTSLTAGLNYRFEHVAVGLNLAGDSEGDYNATLGLSFSLGRDPRDGSLAVRPRPFARQGAVSAQVFLDRNNNGVFDADEPAIADAGFSGPRIPRGTRTDDGGGAFIVGLAPYRETEIGLNEGTLEDPFWTAASRPVAVVSRPGATTTLLFPVIETGEVDGTVMIGGTGDSGWRPGAAMRVLLSDLQGRVVAQTTSAYDGYYFLGRIPYGRYRVSLDSGQLQELGYLEAAAHELAIDAEEPFAIGLDLAAPLAPPTPPAGSAATARSDASLGR
jgi:hypothetical protein